MTALPTSIRELDSRHNDGIDIRLLWREHDNQTLVAVHDTKTGEAFCLDVRDGDRPLDVFHHPYAYAALRPAAHTMTGAPPVPWPAPPSDTPATPARTEGPL